MVIVYVQLWTNRLNWTEIELNYQRSSKKWSSSVPYVYVLHLLESALAMWENIYFSKTGIAFTHLQYRHVCIFTNNTFTIKQIAVHLARWAFVYQSIQFIQLLFDWTDDVLDEMSFCHCVSWHECLCVCASMWLWDRLVKQAPHHPQWNTGWGLGVLPSPLCGLSSPKEKALVQGEDGTSCENPGWYHLLGLTFNPLVWEVHRDSGGLWVFEGDKRARKDTEMIEFCF